MNRGDDNSLGERLPKDREFIERYLRGERLPWGLALKKGVRSVLFDPWLTLLKYLDGPIGFKLRQLYYARRFYYMGDGVLIDPGATVIGPENISMDRLSYLARRGCLVATEGYIRIGKRSHIGSWVLGHGGVEIGNYVGAGNSSILSATDSHRGGYRMAGPMIPMEQRNVKKAKVVIEDDAFIGHFSTIMPGVTIGEGAIVSPNSLVVGDVEPWTVVKGSPAVAFSRRKKVRFPSPD